MAKPLLLVEALAARNDSGLGAMTRLFVDGLGGLADRADILVLLPKGGSYRPGPHCRTLEVDPRPWRIWAETVFPLLLLRYRPAAVLCLGQTLPRFRPKARYALAIPDAGPLEDLGWPTSSHDAYNRRWLRSRAPHAERLLAISAFTRNRLQALLGYPEDRIDVVLPIRPPDLAGERSGRIGASAPGGHHPSGEYFLSLGNVEPRKNYPGLIAAYAALLTRRPEAPPLFIAGHPAWGQAEAEAAVSAHGLQGRVHFTGYLSEADRSAHLAECTAYVSSSLYEGWGLPLFEALGFGKPAIYHGESAQDEFARGLALAVDCRDPQALSRAMETVWKDAAERERLRAALAAGFPRMLEYDLEGALRSTLLPLLDP
ncbi:MAG: glycosyltransferase family 4 protein [Fibrobacteres bacterium]|nr:glycosyltransferase family 4 protein [Fibrobacterota bacterium]